ncbi:arf-GAP with Rho-GAP domain, ANK repeat and PH domain-containing protein 2 [Condylostylus longicornis]|uniref:arf-GAP with Rho-GAP domain, ANK repeat and PH domain-containing protein 2 n=1 Tax=Condylostylus longicornis TaxID=2530218 RepID=UPI00244DD45E|nr:arf-GAP with Rho-GAP domain, ANK repeat and PH domain-containing protein 2 [Condylostylus longicornis]
MENAESGSKVRTPPIPKPRRLLKKSQYENVVIPEDGGKNDKIILCSSESATKDSEENLKMGNQTVEKMPGPDRSKITETTELYANIKKPKKVCKDEFIKTEADSSNNNLVIVQTPFNCEAIDDLANKDYDSVFITQKNGKSNNTVNMSVNSISSVTSRASTPEPFYVNQDQVFGNFEFMNITCNIDKNFNSPLHREVLYEFDPLMRQRNSTRNDVSNQLLLLESLLEDGVYNNVFDGLNLTLESDELSDEDNLGHEKFLPPIPTRFDSLDSNLNEKPSVHVGGRDNMVNLNVPLKKIEKQNDVGTDLKTLSNEKDIIQSKKTQTSWYLNEEALPDSQSEEMPPPYSPNVPKNSIQKYVSSLNDINFNINGRTEINKMFSNFRNKISVLKRKSSIKSTRSTTETEKKFEIIPRPKLTDMMVRHEGFLIKFPSGAIEDIFKEMQNRKAIMSDYKFLAYQESELKNLKEKICLNEVSTIQCVSNSKITENSTHYYCFEITTVTPKIFTQQKLLNSSNNCNDLRSGNFKAQRLTHLYGISKESERDLWMQKLLQSLTNVFPTSCTCQFYRAGWCYLKKSITAEWSGAWILLTKRKRKLAFFTENDLCLEKLDLRKARCIVIKDFDNSIENLCIEKGPILMIDCPPFSLYFIMSCPRETKIWKHIICEVACNNGPGLEEQQLTKHNIPVIIDKCINFIYIHGSMVEGIYRKSGSENAVQKLIYNFRLNAFGVEITKAEYNEHDVANVLKRFMRNLPQKLLGKYSESFVSVSQLDSLNDKITSYKELLSRLSSIEFMTVKKLINHLSFIESQCAYNKMTLENLAVVWGPTLLQTKRGNEDLEYNQQEAEVVMDLILNFKKLFPLTKDELDKEKSMLHYLKKYYAASETLNDLSGKQSGDLKVWVILKLNSSNEKSEEESNNICVILQPGKTAIDVCKEIAAKINKPYRELSLFEVIFNGCLERPLNDDEKLFQIVLRWSYWSEEQRRDNALVIKSSKYLLKMNRTLDIMKNYSLNKAIFYADNKTKTFKPYEAELKETQFCFKKVAKNGKTHKYLNLQDYLIYLGSERKISYNWAITLIENYQNLSLKNPETSFIGHVIAGHNKDDQIVFFSHMWKNIYGDIKIS